MVNNEEIAKFQPNLKKSVHIPIRIQIEDETQEDWCRNFIDRMLDLATSKHFVNHGYFNLTKELNVRFKKPEQYEFYSKYTPTTALFLDIKVVQGDFAILVGHYITKDISKAIELLDTALDYAIQMVNEAEYKDNGPVPITEEQAETLARKFKSEEVNWVRRILGFQKDLITIGYSGQDHTYKADNSRELHEIEMFGLVRGVMYEVSNEIMFDQIKEILETV